MKEDFFPLYIYRIILFHRDIILSKKIRKRRKNVTIVKEKLIK